MTVNRHIVGTDNQGVVTSGGGNGRREPFWKISHIRCRLRTTYGRRHRPCKALESFVVVVVVAVVVGGGGGGGGFVVVAVVVFVVVVLTLTRIIKSVVTAQAPVTLELARNTPDKTHKQPKVVHPYITADAIHASTRNI